MRFHLSSFSQCYPGSYAEFFIWGASDPSWGEGEVHVQVHYSLTLSLKSQVHVLILRWLKSQIA